MRVFLIVQRVLLAIGSDVHENGVAGCKSELQALCSPYFDSADRAGCISCVQDRHNSFSTCSVKRAEAICSDLGPVPPSPPVPIPVPTPIPSPPVPADAHFVALDGDDGAAGTHSKPFSTLQHCLTVAPSGGTCYLAGGRYDRQVDQDVVVNKPVTISGAFSGTTPAILDGSRALSTAWKKTNGCTYKTVSSVGDISQLWVSPRGMESVSVGNDNELTNIIPMTLARFPNAKLSDDTIFDSAPHSITGRRNGSMLYSTKVSSSTKGLVEEDGHHQPSMASSGLDFTGSIAVLPLGIMGDGTQGVRVTTHGSGSSSFLYDVPDGMAGKGHANNPFFFEGSCTLLDAEGEWCLENGYIRVWLDGCADPNEREFRGKVSTYLLTDSRSVELTMSHLTLWGGTLSLSRSNVVLDNVHLLYPSSSQRALDQLGLTPATRGFKSLRISESTIAWDDSTAPLSDIGANAYLSGNLFTRNGYGLGESAAVTGAGDGMVFEHNTVDLFNSFAGITPGKLATVAYNLVSNQMPECDGAGIHVHIKPQNGILIYRNWAHDMTGKAFRFDRVNSATAKWGENGTVVGNVQLRTGMSMFKGDKHIVANNLCLDVIGNSAPALATSLLSQKSGFTPCLNVMMFDPSKSWSIDGENAHTVVRDNAADSIFNVSGKLPGIHSGNAVGESIRPMLRDADAFDFRPVEGAAIATIGPYPLSTSAYWRPGSDGNSQRRDACRSDTVQQAQSFYDDVRRHVLHDVRIIV